MKQEVQPPENPKQNLRRYIQGIIDRLKEAFSGKPDSSEIPRNVAMNRRELLRVLGTGFAGLCAVQAGVGLHGKNSDSSPQQPVAEPIATADSKESHDTHRLIDIVSATAVVSALGKKIVGNVRNGTPLSFQDALDMGFLEISRLGLKEYLGGAEGKRSAQAELETLLALDGVGMIPVLVLIMDIASSINANADLLLGTVKDSFAGDHSLETPQQPSLEDDLSQWEEYERSVSKALSTRVAKNAGATFIVAPVNSIYIASPLADQLKGDVLLDLYYQSYARAVIDCKKKQKPFDHNDVQKAAQQRADELFNGRFGYSKLLTTLAASTQGSVLLGDASQLFFYLENANNPGAIAEINAFGGAFSLSMTYLLHQMWLQKAGLSWNGAEFSGAMGAVLKQSLKTFSDSAQRDASLGEGGNFADTVLAELATLQAGDQGDGMPQKIRKVVEDALRRIPRPALQCSVNWYLRGKVDAFQVAVEGTLTPEMRDADAFMNSSEFTDFLGAVESHRATGEEPDGFFRNLVWSEIDRPIAWENLFSSLFKVYNAVQLPVIEKLAKTLEGMLQTSWREREAASASDTDHDISRADSEQSRARVASVRATEAVLMDLLEGRDAPDFEKAKALINEKGREAATDVFDLFSRPDRGTIAAAFSLGVQNAARDHSSVSEPPQFLSKTATETLWVILAQYFAIPSSVFLAEHGIPRIAGIKTETISRDELKKIIIGGLLADAAIGAVEDNLSAYRFSCDLIERFLERGLGKGVMQKYPRLQSAYKIFSLLVAKEAGNLTKIGTVSNLAQSKNILTFEGGKVSVAREYLPMGETLPHKNVFSSLSNGILLTLAVKRIFDELDQIPEQQNSGES